MSELLRHVLSIDEYQQFVVASRHNDQTDEAYANFLDGEFMETFTQHGPGSLLLMPGIQFAETDELKAQRYHMADEMGDILWFATDKVAQLGQSASELCLQALQHHAPEATGPLSTFTDIEQAVITHAENIRIPNKMGMTYPDLPEHFKMTNLVENPYYLMVRTAFRVSRSLRQGKEDLSPPTATVLEPISDISQALGDYLNVLAYVARARLGIGIENIARFNMDKLKHRDNYGKAKDIQFDDSYAQ